MKKLKHFIQMTLLLTSAGSALAESPVWKVSKDGHHVYLGGTFHMLADSDYPLPKSFDAAYAKTSKLVFETDIETLKSPKYQLKMLNAMTLNNGKTLKDSLKPATYAKLQEFFKARGIQETSFLYFTPTGVALTIAVMEYQRLGMNPESGVDQYFHQKAQKDGKGLDQLNTPEEQIHFISTLGTGQEDEMILQTLTDIEKLSSMTDDLKAAWRTGDVKKLDSSYLAPIQESFPDAYNALFVERNNDWVPKIMNYLKDAPVEFVLVGAVHMAGEEGLLKQLRDAGCKIENL